jgi:hypothetical protein
MTIVSTYLKNIEKALATGDATEHSYRPALKEFIESLAEDIEATNEPKREQCGAPDFIVTKGKTPIGYIETKNVGKPLDIIERDEQLKRYRTRLGNLILTDYLEFRWYVQGEHRLTACLAYDDITRYQRIVVNLAETIRLMAVIDETINSHGGWPIV